MQSVLHLNNGANIMDINGTVYYIYYPHPMYEEANVFSLFTHGGGGGTQSGPDGGVPQPGPDRGTLVRSRLGVPQPVMGYPLSRDGVPPTWSIWRVSQPGMGYPTI